MGFEPLRPLKPMPKTWATVQGFIPRHLANMKITIEQGRDVDGFYCPNCKFHGHLDAMNVHIGTDGHMAHMGVWSTPVPPTSRSRSRSPSRAAASSASGPDPMQSAPRTPTYGGPAAGNWPPVDDTRRLDAYASPAAPPENPWAHMQVGSSAVAAAPSGAAPWPNEKS